MTNEAAPFRKSNMNTSTRSPLPLFPLSEIQKTTGPGWPALIEQMACWPKPVIMVVFAGLVLCVGWIDYITGLEISVSLLYLIPIALAAWVSGRLIGSIMALASAAVWLGADFLSPHAYGHWFFPVWNTLTLTISFLVIVALTAALREVNEGLEQTVELRTKALKAENCQRRQAQEDLHNALDEVNAAHAELQRTQFQLIQAAKMESVGRLATGVAHEVKNPLMTLSLGADYFLHRKSENGDELQLVQDMKEAVHRASNVIDILLDYARPRPLERAMEDIAMVIETSLALVRHQLNSRQVTVVREFDPSLPPLALDRTRIEQVFVNLFLNAIQAMPAGGTLIVRTFPCSPAAGASASATGVMVHVDDTGHGIKPENASRLFEPFFTTKPPGQGTGLGLAMARRIMEIHGGTIRLTNRAEGGARVALQFNTEQKEKQ
jgi:signal transduction histidine kinase